MVRTVDYLITGIVARLSTSKFKGNTEARRASDKAAVSGWLKSLSAQRAGSSEL